MLKGRFNLKVNFTQNVSELLGQGLREELVKKTNSRNQLVIFQLRVGTENSCVLHRG